MPKKLTDLVKDAPESQVAEKIKESAGQIWLAGLGAFATAQKEGVKMFEALVAEGEKFQERTKDRVARALHSLSVPSRKDIDVLSHRVAELTKIARKLTGELEEKEEELEAAAGPARKRSGKAS